jgi:hypothetical protein
VRAGEELRLVLIRDQEVDRFEQVRGDGPDRGRRQYDCHSAFGTQPSGTLDDLDRQLQLE